MRKASPSKANSLQQRNIELENILDGLDFAIILIDEDFNIKRLNRAALTLSTKSSYLQSLNRKCHKILFNKDEPCSFCEKFKTKKTLSKLFEKKHRVIHQIPLDVPEKPFSRKKVLEQIQYVISGSNKDFLLVELFKDITVDKEREDEHYRNQKLISLGTVVQSVAHDLSNPLAGINLTLQRMENTELTKEDLAKSLKLLKSDTKHAAHIVSQIQFLIKRSDYRLQKVKIYEIIKKSFDKIKRLNKEKFKLIFKRFFQVFQCHAVCICSIFFLVFKCIT